MKMVVVEVREKNNLEEAIVLGLAASELVTFCFCFESWYIFSDLS